MQEVLERIQEQMQNSQRGGCWFSHHSLGEESEIEGHGSVYEIWCQNQWNLYEKEMSHITLRPWSACCFPGQHTVQWVRLEPWFSEDPHRGGSVHQYIPGDMTQIIQTKAILLILIWFFESRTVHAVISHSHEWLSAVLYTNCTHMIPWLYPHSAHLRCTWI